MKDRLAQFLKSEGLTAVKFAEIMEVQPSSISHLLSGRNKPNFEFISRLLLRFPDLNSDWIINGTGSIYKSKPEDNTRLVTDVNNAKITNVITSESDRNSSPLEGLPNLFDSIEYSDNNKVKYPENDVTNGNTQVKIEVNDSELQFFPDKKIERIVIFYSDGSFDDYRN